MKTAMTLAVVATILAACQSTPTFQTGEDAEVTHDGLTLVENTTMDVVWARTDIDLTSFNKVLIEPVGVEFRAIERGPYSGRAGAGTMQASSRNRNEFRLDEDTKARVVEEISKGLRPAFENSDKFDIVTEPDYDVLLIRVALLDIVSRVPPEPMGPSQIYLDSVGEATLVLELRDSMSNRIFLRAVDRRAASRSSGMVNANPVTTMAEVRRMARDWGRVAVAGLESLLSEGISAPE